MEKNLYDQIAEDGIRLPSEMGIYPNDIRFVFTQEKIENALKHHPDFTLSAFEVEGLDEENTDVVKQKYRAEVVYQGKDYSFNLRVVSSHIIDLREYGFGNYIAEEELAQGQEQPFYLETSQYFSDDALASFHLQLKIMHAIVSQPSLVLDFMPVRMLSGKWVQVTAASKIPPAPHYLFTVHGVYDESTPDQPKYWMHTHGLHRCGSVELEMLNINMGINELYGALNVITGMFLDPKHRKEENEVFDVGYDGLGVTFTWKRWEEVLDQFPDDIPGGMKERQPENENYGPSGVLFAVQEELTTSPEVYASSLANNPIYFITDEETERMSALAYDRLEAFKKTYDTHKHKTQAEQGEKWTFLIKLGLPVDEGSGNEHLWFEVVELNGYETIKGRLLNQPYWIEGLHEGDENVYDMHLLTDWIIYAPENTYTPDTVYEIL